METIDLVKCLIWLIIYVYMFVKNLCHFVFLSRINRFVHLVKASVYNYDSEHLTAAWLLCVSMVTGRAGVHR